MNLTPINEITSRAFRHDSFSSFVQNFASAYGSVRSQISKVETRQYYHEAGNPSWDAWMIDHDWAKSTALIPETRMSDKELFDKLNKQGVDFIRCRPIAFPLNEYMKWELEVFKTNQKLGEKIYWSNEIATREFVAKYLNRDFMIFDASKACIHDYNDAGELIGGWWVQDRTDIINMLALFAFLKVNSQPFRLLGNSDY